MGKHRNGDEGEWTEEELADAYEEATSDEDPEDDR